MSEELRREADQILRERLAAIETEIREMRKLSEQVVKIQERLANHLESASKSDGKLEALPLRVSSMETKMALHHRTFGYVERLIWAILAAVGSAVGYKIGIGK